MAVGLAFSVVLLVIVFVLLVYIVTNGGSKRPKNFPPGKLVKRSYLKDGECH